MELPDHILRDWFIDKLSKIIDQKITAIEVESVFWNQADSRKEYIQHVKWALEILPSPCGEFLEQTYASIVSPQNVQTIIAKMLTPEPKIHYINAMFYRIFKRDPRFTDEQCREYSKQIAQSCAMHAQSAQSAQSAQDAGPMAQSAVVEHVDLVKLSSIAAKIAYNLDPEGIIARDYGTYGMDQIFSQQWDLNKIAQFGSETLCPASVKKEQDELYVRTNQTIHQKVSQLYKCPQCKQRQCTYREVQTRGLDEAATIFCTCILCGFSFTGHN